MKTKGARKTARPSPSTPPGLAVIPESAFLRPQQVVDDDSPIFTLRNAEVVHPASGELANLLTVISKGPFTVRGVVDIEPDNVAYRG